MLGISIFVFLGMAYHWWLYPAFILAPDLSMLGYLINTRVGAISYNLFHHKGIALLLFATGMYFLNEELIFSGIILFGHSSMDRILGYGLKYPDSFHHTHLGWIGKNKD